MAEDLFRKKSLDKIKSPEQLNEYVRVANPGVWLILCAVIVLLAGFCVWGIFGRIETAVSVRITVVDGAVTCIAGGDSSGIKAGMTVEAGGSKGNVKAVNSESGRIEIAISLPDGVYEGKIVTDSIAPFSFVFN